MKKKIVIVLLIAAVCMGFYFVRTPEYALLKIAGDIKKSGIDGLRPHLTGDAKQALDILGFVGSVGGLFGEDDADFTELESEIEKMEWKIKDITKSSDRALVNFAINQNGQTLGTMKVSMVHNENGWKIDDFDFPKLN